MCPGMLAAWEILELQAIGGQIWVCTVTTLEH